MGLHLTLLFLSAAFYGYRVKKRVEFHESRNNSFLSPNSLGSPGTLAGSRRKLTSKGCLPSVGHPSNPKTISAGQLGPELFTARNQAIGT